MRRPYFLAAGILGAAITAVHLVLGQITIVEPMLDASFDDVAKQTLLVCWHIVSVDLVLTAAGLIAAGVQPEKYATTMLFPAFLGLHYLLWGGVFLVVGVATSLPLGVGAMGQRLFVDMPQWLLFFVPVVLVGQGLRRLDKPSVVNQAVSS